jgi:hypothetical protein
MEALHQPMESRAMIPKVQLAMKAPSFDCWLLGNSRLRLENGETDGAWYEARLDVAQVLQNSTAM